MHIPHVCPSSHIVFYKQSFFDIALVIQRKKLCALPLLRMNPGFGDSECQIIGTKHDRANRKRKNTFRTKTKTSNSQQQAIKIQLDTLLPAVYTSVVPVAAWRHLKYT